VEAAAQRHAKAAAESGGLREWRQGPATGGEKKGR
jgi:hypothetical protein